MRLPRLPGRGRPGAGVAERLIENGLPTEALVAQVLVAKYADHLPLHCQAQIWARQGIDIDRSTLADWVGRAAFEPAPVRAVCSRSSAARPSRGLPRPLVRRRDDGAGARSRAWPDQHRPAVGLRPRRPAMGRQRPARGRLSLRSGSHLCATGPASGGVHRRPASRRLGAYRELASAGAVEPAFCGAHVQRNFYELQAATPAPIASEALARIAGLYAVGADIRGQTAEQRREVCQRRSMPILEALKPWLEDQLALVSGKARIATAIRHALSRWQGLSRFLDDGRLELDSNAVECPPPRAQGIRI